MFRSRFDIFNIPIVTILARYRQAGLRCFCPYDLNVLTCEASLLCVLDHVTYKGE